MDSRLLTDLDFLKLLGQEIKSLRCSQGYSQETLALGIKDRTIINKIENGKLESINILDLKHIAEKLNIGVDRIIKNVFSKLNSNFNILIKINQLINNCDFVLLKNFCELENNRNAISKKHKLALYVKSAFLFKDGSFNDIITNLENEFKNINGIQTILDIFLINYYFLAYLEVNYEIKNKISSLELLINNQKIAIEYYIDYYPKVMIRMLINLVDYFRIIGKNYTCSTLLKKAENYCYSNNEYDSLIDIYLNEFALDIEYNNGKKSDKLIEKIEACFKVFEMPNKMFYIKNKFNYLKELYEKYCLQYVK